MTQTGSWEFTYGLPGSVQALLTIPFISIILTIGLFIIIGAAWWSGDWSLGVRIYSTYVAIIAVAFIPFLYYWNLLGWRV